MSKYEKVKRWWETLHDPAMVWNAVDKGWITEAEAREIMGIEETEGE